MLNNLEITGLLNGQKAAQLKLMYRVWFKYILFHIWFDKCNNTLSNLLLHSNLLPTLHQFPFLEPAK